jgi:ATP-dependent exoDNAse (exonuclease V) beta subunit
MLSGTDHPLVVERSSEIEATKQKLALFLTQKLTLRASVNVKNGFPPGTGAEKKSATEYKNRAKEFIAKLANSGDPGLALLTDFLNLPPSQLDDLSWQMLQDLLLIVRYAAAHLKVEFSQHQQVDFSEIALAALATLGQPDAPNDVALILDSSICHILIDEFQDTSFIQIELLERLTAGWQPGDGRSLFLVGDPMQSIYAFRQADVGLFLRLWDQQMLGSIELKPLLLSTNFRSSETIIEWINATFRLCFPAVSDQRKGAVTFSPSVAAKTALTSDNVSIDLFRATADTKEIGVVAEAAWIADHIAQVPQDQSIAILVKGKSHVLQIVATLRERRIPYQAVDIEPLKQSQVVSDLMALARAVWSPNDKVAWFALLRGPWCGLA